MKFEVIEVTPELANKWLELNVNNRRIRAFQVKAFAEAMKRGEWAVTHQPIAINGTRLLDGQHRLMALVQSGLPNIKMSVAFDADSNTFDTIDIGLKRAHADVYREDLHVMHPISYISRLLNGMRQTPRAVRPVYERFADDIRELVGLYNRGTKQFTAAPIKVGALAAILDGEEKAYVHGLFSNICAFNIGEIPRVAQVFVRQITMDANVGRKVHATEREQLLVRSFIVFHKDNADLERVLVRDITGQIERVRSVLRSALEVKDSSPD